MYLSQAGEYVLNIINSKTANAAEIIFTSQVKSRVFFVAYYYNCTGFYEANFLKYYFK